MPSEIPQLAVRAVSLDVTGTMIHSRRLGEIYAEVLRRHGLAVEDAEVERTIYRVWQELDCTVELGVDRYGAHPKGAQGWWRRFLDRLCEHLEIPSPGPFAAAELYDRFGQADAWQIYPDTLATLDRLRQMGLRLVVISNWDPRLRRLMDRLELASYFERQLISSEVGVEKPHPLIFERALEHLRLPPQEVVHVGDRRTDDLEGAEAVGMEALLLDRRGDRGDLHSLDELPPRLGPLPG